MWRDTTGGVGPVTYDLKRRAVAEAVGTAFLLAAITGSGIMGQQLAGGNVAIVLLVNALATGGALLALIATLMDVSGAHLNPAVTLAFACCRVLPLKDSATYVSAQILGAFFGVAGSHLMFDLPVFSASQHVRSGVPQLFSEVVATFGLVFLILVCSKSRAILIPFVVAGYIVAGYWFTVSTSFANPAVTLARSATDTFVGIRPVDVLGFVAAQLLGALVAMIVYRWLIQETDQKNHD
jgi:glycerol uptake facilitator-like aquaporin